MTLDKLVEGDILSTCNALGSEIRNVYQKGQHCIECLKDVLRYLKKDNDDHSILCFLGSIRVLQNDLLPLIKRYDKDSEVFDFTLRILVALTNPALLIYKENIPDDKLARNIYLQLISYHQNYKKAFIDIDVWKVLYEHLKDLLKVREVERSNNENLFIERILILIRNVLHVPSDETVSKQTGNEDSTHDKIIKCLHESKISVLLLYICASEKEHKYCLHVLEITSLMLREHTTETLAKANETRSNTEKDEDLKALLVAREREQKLKHKKIQSLHASRFKGVFCVKNMKSLSDNDYISHKLITSPDDVRFDLQKDYRRKPKNKARIPDVDNTRQSTLSVRLLLKKFCIEFLKTYNKVMVSVKRELLRKVGEDNDDSYYLWAICYFMQFNRFYDFQSALVSETISVQSFHHIQAQITNYQEMMLTDKQKAKVWAKRMQLGVSAYKELLETLKMMEKSQDEAIRESADTLISHVFYVIEYREMLLSLLSNYDEVKFSLSYLAKLIESTQLFLKMLENHSKNHSEIIVQKKQKKVSRKKKKKTLILDEPINSEDQLNEQWNGIISELLEIIQQKHPIPDIIPFDGASEMSFEEQKVETIYKIREALIASKPLQAVGLLRAARELWPDGDSFGAVDIDPDSELNILREIHFSGLQKEPSEKIEVQESDYDEENEEIEAQSCISEQKLDINDVYKRYANHKVVYPCSLLLANYQNNKPQTNSCLIKLLHRIAWNCKMHGLFFQSTIFLTFQKIFHDPDVNSNPIIKEFYRFAKFIMEKFFLAAQKNKKIFVEMLFWKGHKEAYELEEGYGTSDNKKKGWTEEEDEDLKYLFEENKDIYIEGQDVADIILANLNARERTKLQIISALKRLGLIRSAKDLKPEKRKEWQEAEIVEVQHLFEDNKHSDDVMTVILDKLSIKRSRKAVVEKLLELNLIADKKEVRKKTLKKSTGMSRSADSDENEDFFEVSEDNGNSFNHTGKQNFDSSDDEDEINFFKNLDAERYVSDNDKDYTNSNTIELKRKIKDKKSPLIWDALEVAELTNLFFENSESDDIMHDILDYLSKKRSKEAVIEKLLELGLIKSKKEINKKDKYNMLNLNDSINEDSESDLDAPVYKKLVRKAKEKKYLKRQIFSDSDEDSPNSISTDLSKTLNGISQSKKKQPKTWNEEEVIQLNQLFNKHKDDEDILPNIVSNLITKRTKKDVIEKIIDIGLIKNKADLKKKKVSNKAEFSTESKKFKSKNLSEKWKEPELSELNQLYQNHKDSNDIIADILNGLTLKRNRKDIVEKMLEIGLIEDKKEVRKKRISKKANNKQGFHEMAESEDYNKPYRNLNSKNISSKIILSESSDDDVPLISVVSNASTKNDAVSDSHLHSEINTTEEISGKMTANDDQIFKHNGSHRIHSTELSYTSESSGHYKRKRLFIDSDSDDDNSTLVLNGVYSGNSLHESVSMPDLAENLQDKSLFKRQKKKICVLEESDESS